MIAAIKTMEHRRETKNRSRDLRLKPINRIREACPGGLDRDTKEDERLPFQQIELKQLEVYINRFKNILCG